MALLHLPLASSQILPLPFLPQIMTRRTGPQDSRRPSSARPQALASGMGTLAVELALGHHLRVSTSLGFIPHFAVQEFGGLMESYPVLAFRKPRAYSTPYQVPLVPGWGGSKGAAARFQGSQRKEENKAAGLPLLAQALSPLVSSPH